VDGEARGRLGPLLRAHRVAAGLTQDQLAGSAGLSTAAVRDIEQGRTTRPRAASVTRLAQALRLTAGQRATLALAVPGDDGEGRDRAPGHGGQQAAGLRLAVLGPLAAWRDAAAVPLGPVRQRALLGLLVLHAGAGVSRAAIVDALWGEQPPATAPVMIQGYISRLRRLLWPPAAGRAGADADGAALTWDGTGYRLAAAALQSDLAEFDGLSARARQSTGAGDLAGACRLYRQALELWRGQPLEDLDILRGHPALAGLSRRRAEAVIEYADAAEAAGQPADVLGQLWSLAGIDPLDERAHARLLDALAATGQRATALRVYEGMRRRLDAELGVRPGPELAQAHLRVLRREGDGAGADEDRTPAAGGGQARASVIPRQLPHHGGHFTGRAAELAELSGLLAAGDPPGTVVVSAIGGTAGVGKTALAIYWAHQAAARFPDGQLYVNLRGYDPGQPVPAADALAGFLRALGLPGQQIPAGLDERAARYRSLMAGRRALVIADNAASAEQVRPLLPGTQTCVVLVTSRDSLAGLVARDGARRLDLDLLPPADAAALLRALIGERAEADPGAVALLAGLCARLPLALRVAAEFVIARPAARLASLAGELAGQQRLDLLAAGGDPRTAVRAVFSWSYRHLDAAAARAFRLLGLQPCADVDQYAAAALTGGTAGRARALLELLTRAHLIQPGEREGRYAMHDLLRAYAAELAATADTAAQRQAAVTGLLDYYLRTAAAAMDALVPAERHRRPRLPAPDSSARPLVTGKEAALDWLDQERASLIAVAVHAAARGWPGHATALAATLFRYLDAGGHYPEAISLHTSALQAARQAGDLAAEATALTSLGAVDQRQGRYRRAGRHLRQALALYQQAGDRSGQARALGNLGLVSQLQGRDEEAAGHFGQALALYRETGDRAGEAHTLGNLGLIDQLHGRLAQAAEHHRQSLTVCRETGNRVSEAYALGNLGDIGRQEGRYQQAAEQLGEAVRLFRECGERPGEADALTNLGEVELRQGRRQQAADYHGQALALFREVGYQHGEAKARNGLGETALAGGLPGRARSQLTAALDLASVIGDQRQQARAHDGLAHCHHAAGDPDEARRHWQRALAIYTALGAPEAAGIRTRLSTAGQAAGPGDRGQDTDRDGAVRSLC
jgi:DNA-binding SARP family transcriptional activator/Tfp pilus assembly protein PilF/DNA-binding XRE family transcriptional regulator